MDLRENPNWHPLTGELGAGDGSVRVWAEPRLPGESTTDPFCVAALDNRLRLGVADPAATCPTLSAADVAWSEHTVTPSHCARQKGRRPAMVAQAFLVPGHHRGVAPTRPLRAGVGRKGVGTFA